jgi:hypothetical protein
MFYLSAHRRVKGMQNNTNLFSIVEHLWIDDEREESNQ